jgi:hypothetical protein
MRSGRIQPGIRPANLFVQKLNGTTALFVEYPILGNYLT